MRPWVLMRGLDIPFQERLLPFHENRGDGDFRRFSPSGRVPCLVHGAVTVWDSLAITEYLAERHAGIWPTSSDTRAWARSAAAEMHSGFGALRNDCSMNVGVRIRLQRISAALNGDIARLDALFADGLDRFGGPFLAGTKFTAVDAFFAPVATRIQTYGLPVTARTLAYTTGLLRFGAVNEWIDAGLRETWRDASHEQECLAKGEVLEDLRA
jgi:glutathione S-transferase